MRKDVYAVIGSPIAHSLSPLIHETLYQRYHIPAIYLPIELTQQNVHAFLHEYAAGLNLRGVNVTMPLKETVLTDLAHLDQASAFLRSVNTINLATMTGYTTDGSGFLSSLTSRGFSFTGKEIVMIGCGAAGRSIAHALSGTDARSLTLLNRTQEKADALANRLNRQNIKSDTLSAINLYLPSCDLLINTTNLGMAGSKDFTDVSFLAHTKPSCHVYDIVYHPQQTTLLSAAKALNRPHQNGLSMLVHQAFDAFTLWFDLTPTLEDEHAVLSALSAALK